MCCCVLQSFTQQVQHSVIKRAFGELQDTYWNKVHKTLYRLNNDCGHSIHFVTRRKKCKQKMTYLIAKVSITKKSRFESLLFVSHNVMSSYNTCASCDKQTCIELSSDVDL